MGFDQKWINLIMRCVISVSYYIIINGEMHGNFSPSRGLRQRDPLSPYLFLLCTECLSSLLKKQIVDDKMRSIRAASQGLEISHLFFIDDSVIFTRAIKEEC